MLSSLRFLSIVPILLSLIGCSGSRSATSRSATRDHTALDSSEGAKLTAEQALRMMRSVEQEPLAAGAPELRRQAFEWVAVSKHVGDLSIDTEYMKELEDWYPFKGEMLMQYVFGMATWKLTADSLRDDRKAQVEAGLRSVLAAYKNILLADRKLREPFLDKLDGIRKLGRLREYIDEVDRKEGRP